MGLRKDVEGLGSRIYWMNGSIEAVSKDVRERYEALSRDIQWLRKVVTGLLDDMYDCPHCMDRGIYDPNPYCSCCGRKWDNGKKVPRPIIPSPLRTEPEGKV